MTGVNPWGISWSNIGITWGHGWMTFLANLTKLIIRCLHAKKLIYHVIKYAKMVILWVNIRVPSPPSWNYLLRDHMTQKFYLTPISAAGPQSSWASNWSTCTTMLIVPAKLIVSWQNPLEQSQSFLTEISLAQLQYFQQSWVCKQVKTIRIRIRF